MFKYERLGGGDEAKKLSWLIDLEFVRITTTQECEYENNNRNTKLNGSMIKKINSGGDSLHARKNFENEISFTIW